MALDVKKKKAIAAAVAYLIEQEDAFCPQDSKAQNTWANMGKETMMQNRMRVQRRGRSLPMH